MGMNQKLKSIQVVFLSLSLLLLFGCVGTSQGTLSAFEDDQDITKEKSGLYLSIGKSYEENALPEQAIQSYQDAIETDPTNHEAHFSLGKVLIKRGFKEKGIKSIKRALKENPEFTKARNFLAYLYYDQYKEVDVAQKLIDESAEDLTYLNQEETWALKLEIDFKTNALKKNLASSLNKVFALTPKDCTARLRIVKTLYQMNLYGTALGAARNADDICVTSKNKNSLAFLKSLIFIKKKNFLVAEKMLNDIKPDDKKFEKLLNTTKTAVKKKINSRF